MPSLIYAMDTAFYHSLGAYPFAARCEMLRELGYDATYLTLWSTMAWADVPLLASVTAQYGLQVAAVYTLLDITAPPDHPGNAGILQLLETLEGCATVELALQAGDPPVPPSDPRGDAYAVGWLERLLLVAERRGLTLALYPHVTFWLERVVDAVRLCRALAHPALGLVFPGYHWYAVDGQQLPAQLAEAAPYLRLANLCGTRRVEGRWSGMAPTIEPLDEGELDNFVVLGQLRAVGYQGMLGVQGYAVGGDVYTKLRRSLATLRDMERRLKAHPHWAHLRPPA